MGTPAMLRQRAQTAFVWVASIVLFAAAIVQGAIGFLAVPMGPFATDPCADEIVWGCASVLALPVLVSAMFTLGIASVTHRTSTFRGAILSLSIFISAIVFALLAIVSPRFGRDWTAVRQFAARDAEQDSGESNINVAIGDRYAQVYRGNQTNVRLDLGKGATMDLYVPAMLCTFSD